MKHKLSHYDNNTPIEKIHLVFLKLKTRQDERRKVFSDFISYISSVIEPTNNKYSIFFKFRVTEVGKIDISFDSYCGDWGYVQDRLSLKGRDEKLEYLKDTELKYELGKKFKELEKISKNYLCSYFKDVLVTKIEDKFFNRKRYDEDIKEIIIINNVKYIFLRIDSKTDLIDLDEKQPIII